MNTPLLAAALVAAMASVIPATMPANAGTTTLQKCRAPDGSVGYTDRGCAIFGSGSTLEASEPIADIDWGTSMEDAGALATWSRGGIGRRSPAGGCARSRSQLAMDLYGALALGDVNRVAESYHFAGMSTSAGRATMNRLEGLLGREVIDSRSFDPGSLQLLLADASGNASSIDFQVHRYAGCYFVSF